MCVYVECQKIGPGNFICELAEALSWTKLSNFEMSSISESLTFPARHDGHNEGDDADHDDGDDW